MIADKPSFTKLDWPVIGLVLLLSTISVANLYSTSIATGTNVYLVSCAAWSRAGRDDHCCSRGLPRPAAIYATFLWRRDRSIGARSRIRKRGQWCSALDRSRF